MTHMARWHKKKPSDLVLCGCRRKNPSKRVRKRALERRLEPEFTTQIEPFFYRTSKILANKAFFIPAGTELCQRKARESVHAHEGPWGHAHEGQWGTR